MNEQILQFLLLRIYWLLIELQRRSGALQNWEIKGYTAVAVSFMCTCYFIPKLAKNPHFWVKNPLDSQAASTNWPYTG